VTHRQIFDDSDPFGYGKARKTLACMRFELEGELDVLAGPAHRRLSVQNHEGHWAFAPL
jgi:hypothetical protein